MEKQTCPECGEPILGRKDKKFCSDFCRTAYNNKNRSTDKSLIQVVDKILHQNNRILKKLCPEEKMTSNKKVLESHGFDFNFFTNLYKTQKGITYYYCYDFGYCYLTEPDKILIVKKSDYVR